MPNRIRFYRSLVPAVCLAAILLLPACVFAQEQDASSAPDAATIKAILERMKDLEAQVTTLKARVQVLEKSEAAVPQPAQPTVAANTLPEPAVQEPPPLMTHPGEGTTGPQLHLRGYADVGWNTSDQKGATNSFALGQFTLFINSNLSSHTRVLAEAVVEADPATNIFSIELERLEFLYTMNDRLTLAVGRYHTGMGYYNTAYHHSSLMQTTLGRPFLFDFEDHGGILPVHSVGVSATGTLSRALGLNYVAEIGNGRETRTDISPVQNVTDNNNGKNFNLGLIERPGRWPGFQFGFSAFHDHVTPAGRPNVGENILVGHAVYQNSRFEFLNEAAVLHHSVDGTNFSSNIPAFYSQISRRWGNYRPYLRYEYMNVPVSDPLFSAIGLRHGPKTGLRYDINEFAALKFEYGRLWQRNLPPVNTFGTQLSFAF
jgi:hypothetical protein